VKREPCRRTTCGSMEACLRRDAGTSTAPASSRPRKAGRGWSCSSLSTKNGRDRGLTVDHSMGIDPGNSNIMAPRRGDLLRGRSIDLVRKAATKRQRGRTGSLSIRGRSLRDALSPPVVWTERNIVDKEPVSGRDVASSPRHGIPVGYNLFRHEESCDAARPPRKPVGWWTTRRKNITTSTDRNFVRAISRLPHALGLLNPDQKCDRCYAASVSRTSFLAVSRNASRSYVRWAGPCGNFFFFLSSRSGAPSPTATKGASPHLDDGASGGESVERGTTAETDSSRAAVPHSDGHDPPPNASPRVGVLAPETNLTRISWYGARNTAA